MHNIVRNEIKLMSGKYTSRLLKGSPTGHTFKIDLYHWIGWIGSFEEMQRLVKDE